MAEIPLRLPDVQDGINYWSTQEASLDGVLGGFGTGSLPRVDALGSRQFLLRLRPDLSTITSPLILRDSEKTSTPSHADKNTKRIRALDVGAGIGRVTADVLLHLVTDVVLLEPVDILITEACARGKSSESGSALADNTPPWKGIRDKVKSVTFVQGTLQDFDPLHPHQSTVSRGSVGREPDVSSDVDYDVIWCQWCLGHLSDSDIVPFFKRCQRALRTAGPDERQGLIVIKENACSEPHGEARTVFDEQDSSLTRSDLAWKHLFEQAGLKLIRELVQEGLPDGLYPVKMYALR